MTALVATVAPGGDTFLEMAEAALRSEEAISLSARMCARLKLTMEAAGFEVLESPAEDILAVSKGPIARLGEGNVTRTGRLMVTDPLVEESFVLWHALIVRQFSDRTVLCVEAYILDTDQPWQSLVARDAPAGSWVSADPAVGMSIRAMLAQMAAPPHEAEAEVFAWVATNVSALLMP